VAEGDGAHFFSVANGSRGNFRKLRSKVQPQAAVSNFSHGWAWHPRAWAVAGYNVCWCTECVPVCVYYCGLCPASGNLPPNTNYHQPSTRTPAHIHIHIHIHFHNHKLINVVVRSSSSSSFSWLQVARTAEAKIIEPQLEGALFFIKGSNSELPLTDRHCKITFGL